MRDITDDTFSSSMNGFDAVIFAYGQTASGKTFTLVDLTFPLQHAVADALLERNAYQSRYHTASSFGHLFLHTSCEAPSVLVTGTG